MFENTVKLTGTLPFFAQDDKMPKDKTVIAVKMIFFIFVIFLNQYYI